MRLTPAFRGAVVIAAFAATAAAQTVPELIYYKLNEGTGPGTPTLNEAIPSVGNPTPTVVGHNLTAGVGLNGSGALVGVTGTTNMIDTGWQTALTGSWTIGFWCDVSGLPTSTLYYAFGDSTAGSFRCFYNGVAGVGNVMLRGPLTDTVIAGAGVGGPHYVHWVYDSSIPNLKGYLDGNLVVTSNQAIAGVNGTVAGSLKVAWYSTASTFGGGAKLDEFRVYNRALSASEVSSTWNVELFSVGLFAGFNATPTSGPAGTLVSFTDTTFSSSGPVNGWAWDFQNDGIPDSFVQNPTFTYTCPGAYTVVLTAFDGINPPSTIAKTNFINISQYQFDLFSTGGGVGDLVVTPVPTACGAAAAAVLGYTLLSFNTAGAVGTGPLFGITPDAITFFFLSTALAPGNPLAFVVSPGLYPNAGPLGFPAGTMSAFAGFSMDGVMVFIGPTGSLVYWSNVDRVAF
ncbi:MAG TPA: LamG-like jellyroll fold domain-containing protein [Planctomycetota bacterium]|nr:LamG-like jellyroll fold domain-containing protein [Planctomycetota bacterium]